MMPKSAGKLVFLDETGASTNVACRYGRGPKSARVVSRVPHGYRSITTFVVALRTTGMTAPMIVTGSMNGEVFLTFIRQYLLPKPRPSNIVMMDNLSSHHRSGVREQMESAGVR